MNQANNLSQELETLPDQLDISDLEQNAILLKMVADSSFIEQCLRKNIEPDFFAGRPRQLLAGQLYAFYRRYKDAPKEGIYDFLENAKKRKRITREQYADVTDLLNTLAEEGVQLTANYLADRLNDFARTRIARGAASQIQGLVGTEEYTADKIIDIMQEALEQLDKYSGNKMIESMRTDPMIDTYSRIITRFDVPAIDQSLGGGLQLGNFVVVLAYTGRGKSWCINHLAKMGARFGHSSLVVPTEMANKTWRLRMQQSLTCMSRYELADNPATVKRQQQVTFLKKSDIYLLSEEEKSMSIDQLPQMVEELEQKVGKKIPLILLDSLDEFEPPKGFYKSKIEKLTAIYTFAKNWAKDSDRCVVTTVQSQRINENKWWLHSSNIGEDINKARKATVGVSINATSAELEKGYGRLFLFKHTDGPVGVKAWYKSAYDKGQFTVYSERFNLEVYREMMLKEGIKI